VGVQLEQLGPLRLATIYIFKPRTFGPQPSRLPLFASYEEWDKISRSARLRSKSSTYVHTYMLHISRELDTRERSYLDGRYPIPGRVTVYDHVLWLIV